MISWNELYVRENMPDIKDFEQYIASDAWKNFYTIMTEQLTAKPKIQHSRCSIPGWNMKFYKKGKNLCTAYPQPKAFQLLVVVNEKQEAELDAYALTCDKEFQQIYRETDFFNGGKWLLFDIDNAQKLNQALGFVQFRLL